MKKPIEELDLEFNAMLADMYVVVDTTTNLEVSPVIVCRNDAMAVDAFKRMCEEQKDKKPAYSKYKLVNIGAYNQSEHRITNGEAYDVVSDDEDLNAYYQAIVEAVKLGEERIEGGI